MENENKDEVKVVLPSETEEQKRVGDENEAKGLNRDGTPKQDPLKAELEKVKKQGGRTKKEKLLYTKQRVEEQLKDLEDGQDDVDIEEDDEKPVTVGMLKKIQSQTATKTALQLAEEIEDETERELTKYHIENTIRPTGDPKKDLELAQVHVNAVRNSQIVKEVLRKGDPKKHSSGGGSNPQDGKVEEELTATELSFMNPPFNLTKKQILDARKAQQATKK